MELCNYTALNSTTLKKVETQIKMSISIGTPGENIIKNLRRFGFALKSQGESDILKVYIENIENAIKAGAGSDDFKENFINKLTAFSNGLGSYMGLPAITAQEVEEVEDVATTVQVDAPGFNDMYIGLRNLQKDVEDGFVNEMLVRSLVDFNNGTRITKLEDIQKEIADYKNLLFSRIASYLDIEADDLYNIFTEEFNVQDYTKVMSIAKERFENLSTIQGSLAKAFSEQKNSNALLDAYNSYALLSNFDEVLLDQQGNRFTVDEKYKNI